MESNYVGPPTTVLVPLGLLGQSSEPAYLDLREVIDSKADDDKIFEAGINDSWGSLAFKNLGDARAWWVIADMSGVIDPFDEFSPGLSLRCPSVNRFYFELITGRTDV